jgi:hypothetical protein
MKFVTYSVAALALSTSAAFSQVSVQAPLSKEQQEFVKEKAPILIQPSFENQTDNLVPFDYDVTMKSSEGVAIGGEATTQDNFNDKAREAITFSIMTDKATSERLALSNVPAIVDWDFIEVGGAVSLNFLFHRPMNKWGWGMMSDRRVDSESAVLAFKKKDIGPSLDFIQMIGWTNAHGVPLYGACSAESAKCLGPDFADTADLEGFVEEQASGKGRVIARIGGREGQLDGRAMILSEHHTHALSFVTDVEALREEINLKKTVIYYPEGAEELTELRKTFDGAIFVSYTLRDREFSSIIRENIAQVKANKAKPILITKSGETSPKSPKAVKSFWNHDVQMMGIPSEFVGADGKASGANPYSSWGITSVMTKEGKPGAPQNHKDANFERINCPQLGSILTNCFYGFFNQEELDKGAALFIRNNFMTDIGELPNAAPADKKEAAPASKPVTKKKKK